MFLLKWIMGTLGMTIITVKCLVLRLRMHPLKQIPAYRSFVTAILVFGPLDLGLCLESLRVQEGWSGDKTDYSREVKQRKI